MMTIDVFTRIDRIRSVTHMKEELENLSPESRRAVILEALRSSSCQFTWSWLAVTFEIPESEWPPCEQARRRRL